MRRWVSAPLSLFSCVRCPAGRVACTVGVAPVAPTSAHLSRTLRTGSYWHAARRRHIPVSPITRQPGPADSAHGHSFTVTRSAARTSRPVARCRSLFPGSVSSALARRGPRWRSRPHGAACSPPRAGLGSRLAPPGAGAVLRRRGVAVVSAGSRPSARSSQTRLSRHAVLEVCALAARKIT